MLAPGVIGARNVKWLGRIEVSEVESDSHWQKRDYKGFHPGINWDNVEDMWDKSQAIQVTCLRMKNGDWKTTSKNQQ